MSNIVLIGFMGVGKGQVGRALASMTALFAIDCDDLIESATNMKIKKIFAQHGEKHFRKWERKTARWLEKNVSGTVISTGGGFVNVPNLHKIGTVVYLHADFDDIIANLKSHPNAGKKLKKRPLLQNMKNAEALFRKRLPLYRAAADFCIDVSGKSIAEVADEICLHCHLTKR